MRRAARACGALPLARLGAFAVLALFVAARWSALVENPPLLRVLAATLVLVALAALLATLGNRSTGRWRWWPALPAALIGTALATLALGVPARLLLPGGWGELLGELRSGLDLAAGASYPYTGGGWAQLTILVGLALVLGAGATVTFWPTAGATATRATLGLAILVAGYGTASTLSPPAAPLLGGLLLFALVAAWLWLPGMAVRSAAMGLGLIAAAGLLALPLCSRVAGGKPLLDYTRWDLSSSATGGTEFFTWNHTYGPIGWPRKGQLLLTVRSRAPHYWRTAVLDRFDGIRWLEPLQTPRPSLELPSPIAGPASAAYLDPRWVHTARFRIEELSSQFVVAAGAPLSIQGLGRTAASDGGIVPTDGEGIGGGDSYTVHYYSPQPTSARMRRASSVPYRRALSRYTTIAVPRSFLDIVGAQNGSGMVTVPLTVPLRSSASRARAVADAGRRLLRSPYASVFRLASRLSAGAPTTYDAVEAINRHLLGAYSYSENPPVRRYPLRSFLFEDREGYCQHFSGAMALMLRMLGIPSRVASGFSPGTPAGSGDGYVVHDFDAHSWVEVYFEGIGWVPFDPTPAASPAASTSPGPALPPVLRTRRHLPPIGDRGSRAPAATGGGSSGGNGSWPLYVGLAGFGMLAAVLVGALAAIARRRRSLEGRALADAQIAELRRALRAMGRPVTGGLTLRRLERDSAALGRPGLAAYAAKLGAYRYGEGSEPPRASERRRMRGELGRHGGAGRALRALRTVPPLGPKPVPGSDG